ncbi:MAG: PEP-CTERM sorting domain-containing protein [Planctomycetaceae bacterium]
MSFSFGRLAPNILCLLSMAWLWSGVGESAVVTYTNRTAWVAALKSPGATTDTFAGLSGNQPSPLVRTDFTATASAGTFRAATNTNGSLPPQPYIVTTNAGATVTFTLNSPQTAIALQALQIATSGAVASRTNVPGNITATVDGVPLQLSPNGPVFFGFTSTSPFTTLTLTRSSGSGALAFDTVEFGRFTGEVLPVPEPGTVTFAGVAIALVGLRHWRRRSAAAAV